MIIRKKALARRAVLRGMGASFALPLLDAMTPAGHTAVLHLTLTDDHPWAQAFVVIEALLILVPTPKQT